MLWGTLTTVMSRPTRSDNDVQGKNTLRELMRRKALRESRRLRTPPLHHPSFKIICNCTHETFPRYLGISCFQFPRRLSDWPPAFIRVFLNLTFNNFFPKYFTSAAKIQNGVGQNYTGQRTSEQCFWFLHNLCDAKNHLVHRRARFKLSYGDNTVTAARPVRSKLTPT